MRTNDLAAAVSLTCTILAASCVQSPTETPEADDTGALAPVVEAEPTGEAAQPGYEDVFHFVVNVKDDGRGKAGGWQKATAILKFSDWRHSTPYFWQCPIEVGMPIRAELQGRISPQYAAQITAEVATDVTGFLVHSRASWVGQTAVYCIELYDHMKQRLNGAPYHVGATVRRP
jgi:hypothetical protein